MRRSIMILLAAVAAGCATTPEPVRPGAQNPATVTNSINLSGYPPEFRRGFTEGCTAARNNNAAGRPKGDGQFAVGWNEVLYLVLVGPVAIIGGFLGGIEHRGWEDGFIRGLLGGLVFGSFILLGHRIAGAEPKADLPDPQVALVFVTTLVGGLLGALGGRWRARREGVEPAAV